MPFDASIAARDPDIPARSPTAPAPTARRESRQTVAGEARSPGTMPQGALGQGIAPGHGVAPGQGTTSDKSPAPAAVPFNAAVPFYSARHPRPVSAISPRLSRGVL